MIQANELRIGNLLKVDTNFWTVNSIITQPFELYFDQNIEYDHSLNAEPIPLTEEWLVRFGFENRENTEDGIIYGITKYTIIFCQTMDNDYSFFLNGYHNDVNLQYVHQLQNLYFALTGEELKYSE